MTFPESVYDGVRGLLSGASPEENACFLLAGSYKRAPGDGALLITGMVVPDGECAHVRGRDFLSMNSSYISKSAMAAESAASGLVLVHTHPGAPGPPEFSEADERANGLLHANLAPILGGRPLASMVMGESGVSGAVLGAGAAEEICRVRVIGDVMRDIPGPRAGGAAPAADGGRFDRQIRAFGAGGQGMLQGLSASVVGLGGTGSSVAVQLARMGVGRLLLVDPDAVEETNLPRVYGSAPGDVGSAKVDVVRRHIGEFSAASVSAVRADATEKSAIGRIVGSDVIFACTDNHTSRSVLNDVSYRHYIPLIDVGCRIYRDGSGPRAVARVQAVTPDSACLWCAGTLDGRIILQESFSGEEKARLAKEGYYEPADRQPSVISLTTLAASMAVDRLLRLVGALGGGRGTRTVLDMGAGHLVDDRPAVREGCTCRERMGRPGAQGHGAGGPRAPRDSAPRLDA